MAAPALTYQTQGQASVSADNLNTYEQTCDTVAQLRAFVGITGLQVFVRAYAAFGDGGAGPFVWNAAATAADDGGVTTIAPVGYSASTPGRWLRIGFVVPVGASPFIAPTTQYTVPVTGFVVAALAGVGALILNPAGTLAAGTIVFPAAPVNNQTLKICSTQIVTALTLTSAKTVNNPIAAMAAGGAYAWQFLASPNAWFKIQ